MVYALGLVRRGSCPGMIGGLEDWRVGENVGVVSVGSEGEGVTEQFINSSVCSFSFS